MIHAWAPIATLPHRHGAGLRRWEQDGWGVRCIWEAGRVDGLDVGLPSGALARRILIHFLSEAVRADARLSPPDPSLYLWNRALTPASVGGCNYRNLREQLRCIGACRLTILATGDSEPPLTLRWPAGARPADREAADMLRRALTPVRRPPIVAIRRSALHRISRNSTAIDIYIWLADVLPSLAGPTLVDWPVVSRLFGARYKHKRQMKAAFAHSLQFVMAVYPGARVEITSEGILLHPAPGPASVDSRHAGSSR